MTGVLNELSHAFVGAHTVSFSSWYTSGTAKSHVNSLMRNLRPRCGMPNIISTCQSHSGEQWWTFIGYARLSIR